MTRDDGSSEPTSVTRAEFRFSGTEYPFLQVTANESCTARLEEIVPRDDGYAEFFTFTGTDPATVFEATQSVDDIDARLLTEQQRSGLFEFFVSTEDCPAVHLAEAGALPRKIHGSDGTATLVADIPRPADPGSVIQAFLDRYDADLATKRKQSEADPLFGDWELGRLVRHRCTERQREVLLAAYEAGYYEWPRETDAQTLAADLDIASATLHKHLRAAERKIVTGLFESANDHRR